MMNAEIDTDAIERKVIDIQSPELKQAAMTYAQKLRQEGRQEGELKGRLQSLCDSVIEALEIRFGHVPEGLCEEVRAIADEAKLHQLLRTAIQCADIETFAAEL